MGFATIVVAVSYAWPSATPLQAEWAISCVVVAVWVVIVGVDWLRNRGKVHEHEAGRKK